MRKAILSITLLGFLTAGVVTGISMTQYWLRQYEEETDILWHSGHCYIKVQLATVGWFGNRLARLLRSGLPAPMRSDAILFHYTDKSLARYELAGAVSRCRLVGFEDTLHCFSSQLGGAAPKVFRWAHSAFVELPEPDAERVREHFRRVKDVRGTTGWGWHEGITRISGKESTYKINLSSEDLTLAVKKNAETGTATILLSAQALEEPHVLYDNPEKWRRVTRDEFSRHLDPADPRIRSSRSFEDLWNDR